MTDIFAKEGIAPPSRSSGAGSTSAPPKDIFALEGIAAPSIKERNAAALNPPKLNMAPVEIQKEVAHHRNQYEDIAKARFSADQIDQIRAKGPIRFTEAYNYLDAQDVLPGGGVGKVFDIGVIMSATEKKKNGQELSIGEEETLNRYIDKQVEMNLRGMSVGGGIAYYGAQMPAFMIEFAATGGVGKLAQKSAEAAVGKAVKSVVLSKAAGIAANVGARTAALPGIYTPKYAELRMNDYMGITDKGSVIFKESEESPAKSALKAFGYTAAEVASEMSGAAIGKYVVSPAVGAVGKYIKTPITSAAANVLPDALKQNLYTAYKAINPNARVSKIFTATGWNGMLEEMGEERVADVLHASLDMATDKDYSWQDYLDAITPDSDQLLVEAGIVAIAGGVKTGADIAANILTEKTGNAQSSRETVDNLSAMEQDALVNENLEKMVGPKKPAPVSPEILSDEISKKHGADVALQENGPNLTLSAIKVPEADRGQGVGTAVMYDIIQYADQNNKTVSLTPTTDFGASDISRLEKFYSRFGFVENAGDNYDASISDKFIRRPKGDPVSAAQNSIAEQKSPPEINTYESAFDTFYREFADRLAPIEKITKEAQERGGVFPMGQNPEVLARTYAGIIGNIEHNLKYGTTKFNAETGEMEVSGKSLKAIQDDLHATLAPIEGSRDTREADFEDFLISKRILSDLIKRDDVVVSEKDKLEAAKAMSRLSVKYGQNLSWMDTLSKEMYEYQQRVLHNLVDAGNMSQETYDDIIKKNPNYIPFQRVLDDAEKVYGLTSKGIFTNANKNKVINKIKGSEREIKNTTQSVISNTARIIELAQRNRVALAMADLAEVMPEEVQKVSPTMVKRGTAKITVSYDAGLRRKLEAAVSAFGGDVERSKAIKVKGRGMVRGSYSPAEKMVRLRIGSNEGTLAHEFGHMLDHALDLKKKILSNAKAKKELQALAEERLSGKETLTDNGPRIVFEDRVLDMAPDKYMEYIKNDDEILANMYDAYVNSPELLGKKAPTAKKLFDDLLDADPNLAFVKQIKPTLERGDETIEKDVWGPLDTAPQGTITVFRDGKKEYYKVSPPLLSAMQNLNPMQMNATMRLITAPFRTSAKLLRAGATLIPEFWIRNVLRDQGTAFLQSPIRPTPVDMIRGLTAVIGKNDLYKDWMRNGGSFNSFMEMDDNGLEKAYKELLRPSGKISRYMGNPINILADISGALEQATRVGVYGKAQRLGVVGMEAALMSREATLDFARGGNVAKNINQVVPFFNAGVQSVDKLIRTFKQAPVATTFWGMATITVPSLVLTGYYLYGAPDDERREYLEIPQWQKDMFWVFKDGSEWRRIPKPFSFGYLFGSVPERFMNWAYQGDKPEVKEFWSDLVLGIGGTLSPVYDASALLPPLVKVTIEDLTNYNFFTGRNIYPTWMERIEPEKRSQKYTSETSKALGKLLDISPAILDNTLRGQLAGSSDYILDASDFIINSAKEWNGEEVPEKPTTQADMSVIKAFTVRQPVGYGSNSVSNFFDAWEKVGQIHATLGQYDGAEKAEYEKANAVLLQAYKPMKEYYKQIREIGKQSDAIYSDKDMGSAEKVKALSVLGQDMVDISVEANTWFKDNVK